MRKFAAALVLALMASCAAPTQDIDINNDSFELVYAQIFF